MSGRFKSDWVAGMRRNTHFKVDAFDICDLSAAKVLNRDHKEDVKFFNMSVEDMTLDKKYDYVFCSEVLEHVNNHSLALDQIKTIVTEKTELIFSLPNVFSLYGMIKIAYELVKYGFDISKIDPHQKVPFWK